MWSPPNIIITDDYPLCDDAHTHFIPLNTLHTCLWLEFCLLNLCPTLSSFIVSPSLSHPQNYNRPLQAIAATTLNTDLYAPLLVRTHTHTHTQPAFSVSLPVKNRPWEKNKQHFSASIKALFKEESLYTASPIMLFPRSMNAHHTFWQHINGLMSKNTCSFIKWPRIKCVNIIIVILLKYCDTFRVENRHTTWRERLASKVLHTKSLVEKQYLCLFYLVF